MASISCRLRRPTTWCVVTLLLFPAAVTAQDTRAAEYASEQAAKAAVAQPPTENTVERMVRRVKKAGLFGATKPSGFYPVVRTLYPGGWLAFGSGYRHPLGESGSFNTSAAWSMKNFKGVEGTLTLPELADGALVFGVGANLLDAPAVAFYGVGGDSRSEDKTTFGYRPLTLDATATARPLRHLTLGAAAGYLSIDTTFDSIGTAFDSVETLPGEAVGEGAATWMAAPGLNSNPRYLRTQAFAEFDWRASPGYTGRGGFYRVELQDYSDRSGSRLGFRSLEGEAVQLIPILRANWVIAVRALATVTDSREGEAVPFYLMPAIGGNSSVRGYSSLRFRDNHRLLFSGEYRWTATRFLDMAVFYDAGKVVPRTSALNLEELKSAYGIGARFHSTRRTVFRLELARNDERDLRFIWSMSSAF